jgi:peptide/nickel transport system substrate-binding protein
MIACTNDIKHDGKTDRPATSKTKPREDDMRLRDFGVLLLSSCFTVIAGAALAQAEKPRHGGTLEVGTVHVTIGALSWDQGDWPWKFNHDAGLMYEGLMAADLNQSKGRGGKYDFTSFAFLPSDAIRGELAEAWEWEAPMRLVVKLRKGVMFPEKPGVMAAREFVADDVIYAQDRMAKSPKRTSDLYDFIDKTTARDKHTLVYDLKEFVADWDLRLGWGFTTAIQPKEVVAAGASNWKNANGMGPFRLTDYVPGNSQTYERNPIYWGKETINEAEHKLPFVDKVTYRVIKDQSTQITALRTGKLDILEAINWENVETLKKSSPELKWNRVIGSPHQLAVRMDTKPFDDIRVRKALNIAVDKQSLVKEFYGGHAELLGFPMHPDWTGYYEPLEQMPDNIKELFKYDVEKAKKLLAEAGYADGFTFKVQVCACSPVSLDLLAVLASHYEKIKVKLDVQVMEYGAHLSVMNNNTNAPGYLHTTGMANPYTTTRVNFVSHKYNPSQYEDPTFGKEFDAAAAERDEAKRHAMFREMARHALRDVPMVFLPAAHYFIAWWPWVKNYNGETRAGAAKPGPIYARLWIDQELKKKMGY